MPPISAVQTTLHVGCRNIQCQQECDFCEDDPRGACECPVRIFHELHLCYQCRFWLTSRRDSQLSVAVSSQMGSSLDDREAGIIRFGSPAAQPSFCSMCGGRVALALVCVDCGMRFDTVVCLMRHRAYAHDDGPDQAGGTCLALAPRSEQMMLQSSLGEPQDILWKSEY